MDGELPPVPAPLSIHPAVAPLSFLLGTWRGKGDGGFPTINSFSYGEEIHFSHSGKVAFNSLFFVSICCFRWYHLNIIIIISFHAVGFCVFSLIGYLRCLGIFLIRWLWEKPVISYSQKTWKLDSREPMHAESGYWRPKPDGTIEVVIAQSTGLVEVQVKIAVSFSCALLLHSNS